MPKLDVFACPSCGGSLHVEGDTPVIKCQFCGNSVIVPEEFRQDKAAAATEDMSGLAQGTPLKQLGNLIRAGNKTAAVALYQKLFGGGLLEAQAAVDRLALGQGVQVTYMGMPTTLLVDNSAAASRTGGPTFMAGGQPIPPIQTPYQPQTYQPPPVMQPVVVGANPTRGMGCVVAAILLTTCLGVAIALLATGGSMLPFLAFFGDDSPFGDILTNVPSFSSTATPRGTDQPPSPTPAAFANAVLMFGEAGDGGGGFDDPRHIGVDEDGNIYVGEWSAHRVQVFDAHGTYLTEWSAGENDAILTSMTVTADGTVYCVAGRELYYYDGLTGEALGTLNYDDDSGFNSVNAVSDGSLLIGWYDAGSDAILRYRDGQFDLRLPNAVSDVSGGSEVDIKVAGDGDGEIYALGSTSDVLYHFAPDGEFVNEISQRGDEPGQFSAPSAIAVDLLGRVYVSDFDGILVFDSDGEYLDVFDVPDSGFVHGLAVDEDGYLYAVSNNNTVTKFEINE